MKPKSLFELAVKILGLVFVYHGLNSAPNSLGLVWDALKSFYPLPFLVTSLFVAWPFLVAYWLLRGAPLLVNLAFPTTSRNSDTVIQMNAASLNTPEA